MTIWDCRALADLVRSVADALGADPGTWLPSLIGLPSSWGPGRHSEYELVWSGDVRRLACYLSEVVPISLPGRAPGWVPRQLGALLWRPSAVERHADGCGSFDSHRGEAWFFINGILTDRAVAQMNGDYLVELFHRPITLIENATDGLPVDLAECVVERLGATADDVDAAFPPLMRAVKDPDKKRIVVIAHSQGTLILGVVLRLMSAIYARTSSRHQLSRTAVEEIDASVRAAGMRFDRDYIQPLSASELSRLELYCFANCASHFRYIDAAGGVAFPWIESYGNEHDLVARLGVLAPRPAQDGIEIDGPRYEARGAWGHLLNVHYLQSIDRAQSSTATNRTTRPDGEPYTLLNPQEFPGARVPRLYSYLAGRSVAGPAPGRDQAGDGA